MQAGRSVRICASIRHFLPAPIRQVPRLPNALKAVESADATSSSRPLCHNSHFAGGSLTRERCPFAKRAFHAQSIMPLASRHGLCHSGVLGLRQPLRMGSPSFAAHPAIRPEQRLRPSPCLFGRPMAERAALSSHTPPAGAPHRAARRRSPSRRRGLIGSQGTPGPQCFRRGAWHAAGRSAARLEAAAGPVAAASTCSSCHAHSGCHIVLG